MIFAYFIFVDFDKILMNLFIFSALFLGNYFLSTLASRYGSQELIKFFSGGVIKGLALRITFICLFPYQKSDNQLVVVMCYSS